MSEDHPAAAWTRIAVRFPPNLFADLDAESTATRTPMAVLVRESVARELRRRARERGR